MKLAAKRQRNDHDGGTPSRKPKHRRSDNRNPKTPIEQCQDKDHLLCTLRNVLQDWRFPGVLQLYLKAPDILGIGDALQRMASQVQAHIATATNAKNEAHRPAYHSQHLLQGQGRMLHPHTPSHPPAGAGSEWFQCNPYQQPFPDPTKNAMIHGPCPPHPPQSHIPMVTRPNPNLVPWYVDPQYSMDHSNMTDQTPFHDHDQVNTFQQPWQVSGEANRTSPNAFQTMSGTHDCSDSPPNNYTPHVHDHPVMPSGSNSRPNLFIVPEANESLNEPRQL